VQRTGGGQLDATGGGKPRPGDAERRGGGGGRGGWMHLRVPRALSRETNSIPRIVSDARTRRGPFRERESAVSPDSRRLRSAAQNPDGFPNGGCVESARR